MGLGLTIAVDSRGGTPDERYSTVVSLVKGSDQSACRIFTSSHGSFEGPMSAAMSWADRLKDPPGEADMDGLHAFTSKYRTYNPTVVEFQSRAEIPTQSESEATPAEDKVDDLVQDGAPRSGTVILLGETGAGKSTLGNTLLGSETAFLEGGGVNSVTRGVVVHKTAYKSFTLSVMDTPGLNDTAGQDGSIIRALQEGASIVDDCIAFVYVFNATSPRLEPTTREALLRYKSCLGGALRRSLIVVGNTQGAPIDIHEESALQHSRAVIDLLGSDPNGTEVILMSVKPSALRHTGIPDDQLRAERARQLILMKCIFEARDYVDMQTVINRMREEQDAVVAEAARAAAEARYWRKKQRSRRRKARLGAIANIGLRLASGMAGLPM